ncbi:hypothetical protein LRS74_18540 [Streptomyces sp. LX-29]|uniref:hypothetical protein n=1 Tax=Streptomyces sp. LX-29 TaxID=2900152 RepID=UPI00240CEE95|nr:hypothetical protein [Streptomyces sp. LX-29]WFB08818.1 hypothetical protein LRS74_18540 [Streptomyces sp. LX-29]
MTTPPLVGPPPHPPQTGHFGHPSLPPLPPPPPAPPRRRRAAVVGVIAAVLLVVAGGTAGAWWLTRAEDDSALAGRPRVTDRAAGISYAIPEGWKEQSGKDLIDAFTSAVGVKDPAGAEGEPGGTDDGIGGSTVLAGRAGAIPESALERQTRMAARSNAEFFCPDGRSTLEESRATTVSDRPAHTVALRVDDGEGHQLHLRMTLVSVDDHRSAFLLGLSGDAPERRERVDAVVESASVTE